MIVDVYVILGNVYFRRMYDRGLILEVILVSLVKFEVEEYNLFKLLLKLVKSDLDKEVL